MKLSVTMYIHKIIISCSSIMYTHNHHQGGILKKTKILNPTPNFTDVLNISHLLLLVLNFYRIKINSQFVHYVLANSLFLTVTIVSINFRMPFQFKNQLEHHIL